MSTKSYQQYLEIMKSEYRICTKTVMDTIGNPEITFDQGGVCNYVQEYLDMLEVRVPLDNAVRDKRLIEMVAAIKEAGKGSDYDCVTGVSGGVDSTYCAYLLKKLGLRPLAVHLDNGWNSELAVSNISNMLKMLDIDLHTHVLDWREFKSLQIAFLKGSVPDGEIPTDHAITALLYHTAAKHNIPYIVSGTNVRTEGIMPRIWSDGHLDWRYIRKMNEKFGNGKLKNYVFLTVLDYFKYIVFKRIKKVSILDFVDYNKSKAIETLQSELGWRPYGGKHYESIYTRFFQGYVLPTKFSIDKRKGHLSTLICSEQITREEALEELSKPPYPSEQLLKEDLTYVKKKFGFSDQEFEDIMSAPRKDYHSYPNNSWILNGLWEIYNYARKRSNRN
jgi:N-acetyl sugar amidotransferase